MGKLEARPAQPETIKKLQAQQPGDYPDGLLRTVQRCLKIWRSEQALAFVFSALSPIASAAAAELATIEG